MSGSIETSDKARRFFDELWQQGDPWQFETDPFEAAKYEAQLSVLGDRRYGSLLEIGCGAGHFTRMLARLCDKILALDVSPTAIARARSIGVPSHVQFTVADVMQFDHEAHRWDSIVLSETIYYLGWLHTFFDVSWLAGRLVDSLHVHGRLLLTNSYGGDNDFLMRPWIVDTYRDLFLNLGMELERETAFEGTKNDTTIRAQLSLFRKPAHMLPATRQKEADPDSVSHTPMRPKNDG